MQTAAQTPDGLPTRTSRSQIRSSAQKVINQAMKSNQVPILTVAVVVPALLLLAVGVLPAFSSTTEHETASAVVGEAITYQGRLTDAGGAPLNGVHSMRFRLFEQESGGSPIWASNPQSVAVEEGLFKVDLNVNQADFDGRALWLEISVGNDTLAPRQAIRPAPLALGLRPGAALSASEPGSAGFTVRHQATGTAIHAEAADRAIYGAGQNYGVYGVQNHSSLGYGGYFVSDGGVGVYGESAAPPSAMNSLTPGVWGVSAHGVGVIGESMAAGMHGKAATGFGVWGHSQLGIGVYASSDNYAVYAESKGSGPGQGYGGFFTSDSGTGVYGRSSAQPSVNNAYAPGVWGHSEHGAGIYGSAGTWGTAGYFDGNLIVNGDISASGSKAGYVVDIALNSGDEPLESGDVVIITGAAAPTVGAIPVPLVRKADSAAHTGVAGVVDRPYAGVENGHGDMAGGAVAPGEYLSVVTLGAVQAIRVDASYGAIRPGDLLISSPTPGHAMTSQHPPVGAVIGKALDSLETGTGTIPVLVTLH